MIFVTVGTHEQQFDRLIKEVDRLRGENIIQDEVFMQTGFCDYEPVHCKWRKLIAYGEMNRNIQEARIVITHGGPASFISPLQMGKIPIVVPRQKCFGEHVNNHQLKFCRSVSSRMGNILLVEEIEDLKEKIVFYEDIISNFTVSERKHNCSFNSRFEMLVEQLFEEKKNG